LIEDLLPSMPSQSTYNWFDILMSYWSLFFCGGDCAEDLDINIRPSLHNNPFENMSKLNLKLLSLLPEFKKQKVTLDYDNTIRGELCPF